MGNIWELVCRVIKFSVYYLIPSVDNERKLIDKL